MVRFTGRGFCEVSTCQRVVKDTGAKLGEDNASGVGVLSAIFSFLLFSVRVPHMHFGWDKQLQNQGEQI